MADTNSQKQTAASDAAPGPKPAAAGKSTPAATPAREAASPLDLDAALEAELGTSDDNEIDEELDADLPARIKKGKQAPVKPKAKAKVKEPEPEEEDTDEVEADAEKEDHAEDDAEGDDDNENTEDEPSDEELEAAMPENSEDIDPENPPKGLENVPKPVWKRLKKQSEQLRTLKAALAEGAVVLQPTAANPLADVNDIADLDARVKQAREERDWARKHPEGGSRRVNGKDVEVSAEAASEMLERADAIIDADGPARLRLAHRQQTQPWEVAQKLEPALFEKGSSENNLMLHVLGNVPEIAEKLPDWEKLMAYAARGARQVIEESSGKAKYVRFEVGPDGKLIAPKGVNGGGTAKAGGETKPKPKSSTPPPSMPGSQRPPLTHRPAAKEARKAAAREAEASDNVAAMLAAELGE